MSETARHDWPSEPVTLTDENFDRLVAEYPAVFVYMWADACEPCKNLLPRLDDLVESYRGEVLIGTLCTDAYPRLSKQNRSWRGRLVGKLTDKIDGPLPGLLLYVGGDLVARDAYVDSEYDDHLAYLDDWIRNELPDTST